MEINDYMKQFEQEARDRQKKASSLREKVMAILCDAGVTKIDVSFDGYGDSGEVGEPLVSPDSAKTVLEFPVPNTQHEDRVWHQDGKSETVIKDYSVSEALSEICYSLLEHGHGGWEINEGSCGDFVFKPKKDEIKLTFNQRVESYETDEEVF
jgi:hypothetical protein